MKEPVDVPAAYDRIAEKFLRDRSVALREKKYLDLVLAGLKPDARVLDFGCGTGRPIGEYLVERGFAVTGVDGSAGILAIAGRLLPTAELIQGRLEEVELAGNFGAAIAWDSLFHVAREHHAAIYAKLARWIVPGGRLVLSTGAGTCEEPGFTDQMYGETFYYSSWSPERVQTLLGDAGFVVELCETDQPPDPARGDRGHVAIVARRKS
jgi:cyclopropane fatty-acyl-phospholipid synthase-like methyltransferase